MKAGSGRAEGPGLQDAEDQGSRRRRLYGGGCGAAGTCEPVSQQRGAASRPLEVECVRPGELEAESVQDFSRLYCSQRGGLVSIMTQEDPK